MAAAEPKTIGEQLASALELTRALASADATVEQVQRMAVERAPHIEAALAARDAGRPWGEVEADLARRILAADAKLLDELWRPHADGFSWLRERDASIEQSLPALVALDAASRRDALALCQPRIPATSASTVREAAQRYFKTRIAR
jgi:hypothetical protein